MANSKISALTSATTPLAGTETLPIVQSSTTKQVSVANLTAGRTVSMTGLIANTSTLVVDSANSRVGIGTASPTVMCQVGDASVRGVAVVYATAASNPVVALDNTNQASGRRWTMYSGASAAGNFDLVDSTSGGVFAMTVDSTWNIKAVTGNFVVGTSGKGIDFSATPGTGTSELFADYEEGTFTPTFTGLTVGNGSVFGTYRKIGKQVTLTYGFFLGSTSVVGTLSGVTGYPFTTGTIGASRFFAANGTAFKSGVGWYGAYAAIYNAATSGTGPIAAATDIGMAAASPFVWAANDSLSLTATYFVD